MKKSIFAIGIASCLMSIGSVSAFAEDDVTLEEKYMEQETVDDESENMEEYLLSSGETKSMYRMYNPNSGEHFYTSSEKEKESLLNVGWWCEGTGWVGPATSEIPVYRMYNPNAGDHHYTRSKGECEYLQKVGWNYEGIGWYSSDDSTMPVYRQYNPNAKTGAHNYTTSLAENNALIGAGWKAEGIGWNALATGIPYEHPEARVFPEDRSGNIVAYDFMANMRAASYYNVIRDFGQPNFRSVPKAWIFGGYHTYYMRYDNIYFGEFKGTLYLSMWIDTPYSLDISDARIQSMLWYLDDRSRYDEANVKLRAGFRSQAQVSGMWTENESYMYNGVSTMFEKTVGLTDIPDGTLRVYAGYGN